MKGKAQLILTDRDTGRVVDKIEENNIVTNALSTIFDIPETVYLRYSSSTLFGSYLPIYKYLMGGLVMLGSNIKEDPDNYMIPGDAGFIGTAGSSYTGTASTRGTLNQSQSGEIDGGYRFVWDFAPEKAIGTIRCIGLTNLWFGDIHFTTDTQDGRLLVNPLYMSMGESGTSKITYFSVTGAFLGFLDNDSTVYSLKTGGTSFTIYRSKLLDAGKITVTDTTSNFASLNVFQENSYTIPFSVTSDSYWFFMPESNTIFFFSHSYSASQKILTVKYCEVNPKNGNLLRQGEYTLATESFSTFVYAVKDNQLYFFTNSTLRVLSMNGTVLKTIPTASFSPTSLYWLNGQMMVSGTSSNIGYTAYIGDDEPSAYLRCLSGYQSFGYAKLPYVLHYTKSSNSTTSVYLMMRTDYLATINNLSVPLEKTDKHALQVRYEITAD